MTRCARFPQIFVAAAVLVVGLYLTANSTLIGGNPNPKVLPPNSKPNGKTYGEWSARWWQWALGIPFAESPFFDETGENCDVDQAGKVWFLAGSFVGPVERECAVPPGTSLFFPLINNIAFSPEPGETIDDLRALAAGLIDAVTVLEVTIDGKQLGGLDGYRATSPVFAFDIPEDGLLDPGHYDPAVSDGYWLFLAPLSAGRHTIHFHAVSGDPEDEDSFVQDVTYYVTVGK